jgi:hypothetical protein
MISLLSRAAMTGVVLTAVLAAPAAQAATVNVRDARGDVAVSQDGGKFKPLGETRENTDLLRASVTHGPHKVRAKLTFDELSRNRDLRIALLRLKTPTGRTYDATWFSMPKDHQGSVSLARSHRYQEVDCRKLAFRVDYAANTVSFAIPRACLDRPRWVRFTAIGAAVPGLRSQKQYGDVAGVDQLKVRTWSKRVRLG